MFCLGSILKNLDLRDFLFCTLGFITIFHHHLRGHIFGSLFNRRAEANPKKIVKIPVFFSKLHPENEDLSPKVYFLPKWPSLKLTLEVRSTTQAEAVLLELVDDVKALQGERWAPTSYL